MPGYNFRKKITLKKDSVFGNVNLADFPVLVEIVDADLQYHSGRCENKISSPKGIDVSFALSNASTVPLNFEIDSFDPLTGKLTCWVAIKSLSASGSPSAATSLYLYYGSNTVWKPNAVSSLNTWEDGYTQVWHMNCESTSINIRNSRYASTDAQLKGRYVSSADFNAGKIGNTVFLDGGSKSFASSEYEPNTNFTLSAWIRVRSLGREQVILTNTDPEVIGGYTLKLNPAGSVVVQLKKGSLISSTTSLKPLSPGIWYHLSVSYNNASIVIYINGRNNVTSGFVDRLRPGGTVKVGSGSDNSLFFDGEIDEIRIHNRIRDANWLRTEYSNQNNSAAFLSVGYEEQKADHTVTGAVFLGSINSLWNNPENWNLGEVPGNGMNVIVGAGKHLITADDVTINKLVLENGATFTTEAGKTLQVNCGTINNGDLNVEGTLIMSAIQDGQEVQGSGIITTNHLSLSAGKANTTLLLNAILSVTGTIALEKGILNANGNLRMLYRNTSGSAILLPVSNPDSATIHGDVHFQSYVEGHYPLPSTARGWRLLSSPVYNLSANNQYRYTLQSFQESVFVTGPNGSANGFDPSPNNGSTIFTHDQSIPGSLTQKYLPIPNMNLDIGLGKGIFLFSRGERHVVDAYKHQIESAPFSNPAGYMLTQKGRLHIGDLAVNVYNRNSGQNGDGFNLIGNPYASPVRWGSIEKSNISNFVWLYDPLNNSYTVTDDEDYLIPAGAGFFVKVNAGFSDGEVTFKESSKPPAESLGIVAKASTAFERNSIVKEREQDKSRITITLSRDRFSQDFVLVLDSKGNDNIDDADALKVGDGFVQLSSIAGNTTNLSQEERLYLGAITEVKLLTKGWVAGEYLLTVKGVETLGNKDEGILIDTFMGIEMRLHAGLNSYSFTMKPEEISAKNNQRFILRVGEATDRKDDWSRFDKDVQLIAYPNPATDFINIKRRIYDQRANVLLHDLSGRMLFAGSMEDGQEELRISMTHCSPGVYVLHVADAEDKKNDSVIKVLKN